MKIFVGNKKLVSVFNDFIIDDIGIIFYVEIVNKFIGYIVIFDEIKKDVEKVIKGLKDIGIKKFIMFIGDVEKVVKKVGEDLGFDEIYFNFLF